MNVIGHNISVDDDEAQVLALCSCGWSLRSTDRDEKLAAAHRHIAEVHQQRFDERRAS